MDLLNDRFIVRFAESEQDIRAAQRLRYRVFVEELGAKLDAESHAQRLEIDPFDPFALHLCIVDREREKIAPDDAIIGAYRLMDEAAAAKVGGFYSSHEYDIGRILAQKGRKLELGRSCIDPAYRGGSVMALLWGALSEYLIGENIDFLFGTASFHGTDIMGKRQSLSLLYHNYLAPENMRAIVLPENGMAMDVVPPDEIDRLYAMRDIPALIKAYLRLGGRIGDGAFVDHQFNTIDVFVLMQVENMVQKYKALYRKW